MLKGSGDRGQWAQKQVQDWLQVRSDHDAKFAWHRFPDARSARGALAAQPSDFLACWGGITTLIEAKECKTETRLPLTKIRQFGKLQMFHWAGADVLIPVYRSALADWTLLMNADLFDHDPVPKSFPLTGLSFATAGQLLEHYFA